MIHSCSFYCLNPGCIKAQRDELRDAMTDQKPVAWVDVKDGDQGPYEFHGMEKLPDGRHYLYAAPPALPARFLSWNGHNISGDVASIAAAKSAIECEADWRRHLETAQAQPAPAQEPRSTTCTMTDAPCTRNCGLACAMQMEALRQEPAQRLSDADIDEITRDKFGTKLLGVMMTMHREYARAIEAAIVPPGYVVVPMEPTPEMVSAGWNYLPSAKGDWFIKNVWGAMIAAAQKATP